MFSSRIFSDFFNPFRFSCKDAFKCFSNDFFRNIIKYSRNFTYDTTYYEYCLKWFPKNILQELLQNLFSWISSGIDSKVPTYISSGISLLFGNTCKDLQRFFPRFHRDLRYFFQNSSKIFLTSFSMNGFGNLLPKTLYVVSLNMYSFQFPLRVPVRNSSKNSLTGFSRIQLVFA